MLGSPPPAAVQQLVSLYQQNKHSECCSLFDKQFKVNSAEQVSVLIYALSLRKLGKLKESQKAFQRGVKRFPQNLDFMNNYANLLIQIGDVKNAKEYLRKSLKINAGFFEANLNMGRLLSQQGMFEEAQNYFEKALNTKPQDANANIGLAESYLKQGELDLAETIYNRTLQANPGNIKAINNLATVFRKKGNYKRSIELLEQIAFTEVSSVQIRKNLAACYVLQSEHDKALPIYIELLENPPVDVSLHEEVTHILWVKGDSSPFRYFISALGEDYSKVELWLKYIELLNKAEQTEAAERHSQQLYNSNPNNPLVLIQHASLLRADGKLDESIKLARKALSKSKGSTAVAASNELGYSLISAGKTQEAKNIYQSLCKREKDNQGWWALWGTTLRETQDEKNINWLCDYKNLVGKYKVDDVVSHMASSFSADALQAKLLELHSSYKHPIGQSLRNGTQTFEDLFDLDEPIVQQLSRAILDTAKHHVRNQKADSKHPFLSRLTDNLRFKGSWSVCLRSTGFHKSHFHPEGWLSGVYYVDVPKEIDNEGQGWLVFGRPDIPNLSYPGDLSVKPEPGCVVLFPSYMWHGTNPFTSGQHRLTVAFDIIPNKS